MSDSSIKSESLLLLCIAIDNRNVYASVAMRGVRGATIAQKSRSLAMPPARSVMKVCQSVAYNERKDEAKL